MKSICFAGLLTDKNLGDIVILESTEALYKESLYGRIRFSSCRLNLQYQKENLVLRIFRKIEKKIAQVCRCDIDRSEIRRLKVFYQQQLKSADLIVVVGGGIIKFKYQKFYLFLTALIELAEENHIPLVINASGIEGYDDNDFRCQILKKSLNNDIVKSITTRDDLVTLKRLYINNGNRVDVGKVADPAVYADQVYQAKRKYSHVYGIGLVRGEIFKDNERNVGADKVAMLYANIIREMESRRLPYQLFTNGLSSDNEMLPLIKNKLARSDLCVIEPKASAELVETISNFTTVIAARLHANIISYALNIPSVGFVWNDKLALFGNDIGYPERFFEYNQLDAKKIVDAAVLANKKGYDPENRSTYKQTAKSNINSIVDKWLENKYE